MCHAGSRRQTDLSYRSLCSIPLKKGEHRNGGKFSCRQGHSLQHGWREIHDRVRSCSIGEQCWSRRALWVWVQIQHARHQKRLFFYWSGSPFAPTTTGDVSLLGPFLFKNPDCIRVALAQAPQCSHPTVGESENITMGELKLRKIGSTGELPCYHRSRSQTPQSRVNARTQSTQRSPPSLFGSK